MTDLELFGLTSLDGVTLAQLKARHHELALTRHPDRGGSALDFNELQLAYGRLVERLTNPIVKPCAGCRGKKKVPKVQGFHTLYVPCPDCRGKR